MAKRQTRGKRKIWRIAIQLCRLYDAPMADTLLNRLRAAGISNREIARVLRRDEGNVSKLLHKAHRTNGHGPLELAAAVLLEPDEALKARLLARLDELRALTSDEDTNGA